MEKSTIVALSIVTLAALASAADDVGTVEQDGGSCSKNDDQVGALMDAMNCMNKDHLTTISKTSEHNLFPPQVEKFIQLIDKSEYGSREIVLRELISNAANALEKVRLLALEDKKVLDANPELSIGIVADQKHRILSIVDSGIGMTKRDLERNLGTIKNFGAARFFGELPANPNSEDTNRMIEQIGVGLSSAFLIADTIIVYTKHNDDVQYIWVCDINGYSISKDPRGPTLKRGTRVDLVLKEEAAYFLEPDTLKNLIINNVEVVDFPIYLCNKKRIPIELDDDGKEAKTEKKEDNEIRDDEVDAKITELQNKDGEAVETEKKEDNENRDDEVDAKIPELQNYDGEAVETEKKKDNEIRDDEVDAKIPELQNYDGEAIETEKKEDSEIRDDEVDAKITELADESKKKIVEKIVCDWERLNITTPNSYRAKFVRRTLPNMTEVIKNHLRSVYNISSSTTTP